MRKSAIAMAGLALMAAAGGAQAADLGYNRPYAAPAPAYAAYNWMGPYIGANLGYQWGDTTHAPNKPSGTVFGGQAGYNWQNGQMVYGVETDFQWSNADDVIFSSKFSNSWFGTVRGRLGYAMNNVMIYGTGGVAWQNLQGTTNCSAATCGTAMSQQNTTTRTGWTVGGGIEAMVWGNWLARAEYRYADFGTWRSTYFTGLAAAVIDAKLRTNTVSVGLAYKF